MLPPDASWPCNKLYECTQVRRAQLEASSAPRCSSASAGKQRPANPQATPSPPPLESLQNVWLPIASPNVCPLVAYMQNSIGLETSQTLCDSSRFLTRTQAHLLQVIQYSQQLQQWLTSPRSRPTSKSRRTTDGLWNQHCLVVCMRGSSRAFGRGLSIRLLIIPRPRLGLLVRISPAYMSRTPSHSFVINVLRRALL